MGLAKIAADLLDQGTTTKSAEEMNDAIDFIGGAMGAAASPDLSQMSVVVMKDSFETGMRMLSDMARNPAFSPTEIDRQKQQALSGLQVSLQDPEYIANAVFDRMVYGFHPYGLPQSGTPETLAAITRNDLVAFHQQYFVPNNAILAIVGDVTAEEAFSTAKKVFGDWAQRDIVPQKFAEPPEPTRRVIVVNKPDAVQTEVRVGHLGIPRKHADYMAVNLAIRILGGEGSNRLHQVLRTERGLTYGAQAEFDTLKESGDFEAETNTRSEATGEVLRLIIDEFWRLQRERVSERELTEAKNYLTGSFPLTIETPDAIARQVLNVLFYGLPIEELQTIREQVNAVTVDDIQRVARTLSETRSAVDRARRQRRRVRLAAEGHRLPERRNDRAGQSRSHRCEFSAAEAGEWTGARRGTGGRGRTGGRGTTVVARDFSPAEPILRTVSFQQPRSIAPEPGPNAQALLEKVIAAKGGLATLRGLKTITAVTAETVQAPTGPRSKPRRRRSCNTRITSASSGSSRRRRRAGVRRRARVDERSARDARGHGTRRSARCRRRSSAIPSPRCSRRTTAGCARGSCRT